MIQIQMTPMMIKTSTVLLLILVFCSCFQVTNDVKQYKQTSSIGGTFILSDSSDLYRVVHRNAFRTKEGSITSQGRALIQSMRNANWDMFSDSNNISHLMALHRQKGDTIFNINVPIMDYLYIYRNRFIIGLSKMYGFENIFVCDFEGKVIFRHKFSYQHAVLDTVEYNNYAAIAPETDRVLRTRRAIGKSADLVYVDYHQNFVYRDSFSLRFFDSFPKRNFTTEFISKEIELIAGNFGSFLEFYDSSNPINHVVMRNNAIAGVVLNSRTGSPIEIRFETFLQ